MCVLSRSGREETGNFARATCRENLQLPRSGLECHMLHTPRKKTLMTDKLGAMGSLLAWKWKTRVTRWREEQGSAEAQGDSGRPGWGSLPQAPARPVQPVTGRMRCRSPGPRARRPGAAPALINNTRRSHRPPPRQPRPGRSGRWEPGCSRPRPAEARRAPRPPRRHSRRQSWVT